MTIFEDWRKDDWMFRMVEDLKRGLWVQVHNFTDTLIGEVERVSTSEDRTKLVVSCRDLIDALPQRDYMNGTLLLTGSSFDEVEERSSKIRVTELIKILEG